MIRPLLILIGCGWLFGTTLAAEVPVLVYHDIQSAPGTDEYVVSSRMFREQMAFLKRQGYQPISLRHFAAAAADKAGLPDKPVVLSFDDGLASFRDIAMPVLAEFGFPAVLSVVTGWIDGQQVPSNYRGQLLSWEQLRAISRSPLVEILSHTDNLHHGILANPQGNLTPVSITRRYDAVRGRYETEAAFRNRIRADLARSAERLRAELGVNPAGIAWPYGFYDQILAEEATTLGMRYQLTLAEVPARLEQFPRINRAVLRDANSIAVFENTLLFERSRRPMRIIEVELDDMASRSAAEQEQWLSALLPRLQLLRANAVVVNPFTRDGSHAFFQNNRIPMRAEVLHRFLHQVRTRAGIDFLLLRIPAIPGVAQAAPELARRHPYDGVLLAAGHSQAEATALQGLFGYYHPGVRCGREQGAAWPVCQDFMLVNVDLPVTASNPAGPHAGATAVYLLLQNQPDADGAQIAKSLHDLRTAGARDYGLRYGTFLDNPVNLRRVAAELAAHSSRGARN
jgi:peptidoglycan/xylan/chitin deacetylase (PgdA/CDA1 family)